MPAALCFGPAATLLRVFADCAERLYRFWERMVERTRASGMDSLDPRMVRIRFMPLTSGAISTSAIDLSCANLPTSDSFAA